MKKILTIALLFSFNVLAADADYKLIIKDHRFEPGELTVPASKKLTLLIENQDSTPEEFDSHALNREKMISAHGTIKLYIGPLNPGSYAFDGEFHAETAKGTLIAR